MSDKYNKIMHQTKLKGVSLSGYMHRILGMRVGGGIEYVFDSLIDSKTGNPVSVNVGTKGHIDWRVKEKAKLAGRNARKNIGGGSNNSTETI